MVGQLQSISQECLLCILSTTEYVIYTLMGRWD